jgi:hypothetical protein
MCIYYIITLELDIDVHFILSFYKTPCPCSIRCDFMAVLQQGCTYKLKALSEVISSPK